MLYTTKEEAQTAADLVYCEPVAIGDKWAIKPILLTVDQVAGLLDVSKRQVWYLNDTWKKDTNLPQEEHPTPGKTRWVLADIMKYLTY